MAATELATAYIGLVPSTRGMGKAIVKEFGEVEKGAERSASRAGEGFKKGLTSAAKFAGAAVATVLGASLAKGFQRLSGIENAQAKLRGLGHDAKSVESIMDNALASVKGTAFGLDEAATTAAGAVAAGIKPGQELEGVLKSVANSAAASGSSMDEMGAIYNKVSSLGKAQNDVLQQVADKGIPIYQALADQFGVTADEIFDMATKGQIGFEDFEKAMTSASGTVADEMGKTTTGALSNLWAALGRFGAGLLGGVFPHIAPLFTSLTAHLDVMAEKVGPVASEISEKLVGGLKQVGEWISNHMGLLKTIAGIITGVAVAYGLWNAGLAIHNALSWAAYLWASKSVIIGAARIAITNGMAAAQTALNAAMAANPIGIVIIAIVALVAALVLAYKRFEWFRNLVDLVWSGIRTAIGAVATWFTQNIWPTMRTIITAIGNAFTWFYQNVILPVWSGISTAISAAWTLVKPVFAFIANAIKVYLVAYFTVLWNVAKVVWAGISTAINVAWAVIKVIWDALAWYVKNILGTQFKLFLSVVQVVWNAIKLVIGAVWNFLRTYVFGPLVSFLKATLGPVFTWLYNAVIKPVWDGIKTTVSTVWTFLRDRVFNPLVTAVKNTLPGAFRAGRDAIGRAWDGLKDVAKKPVRFVIDTVINNGIIAGWNKIAKTFKAKEVPKIALPKGFDTGGYTGPGRKYKPAGIVHADEYVIRKSSQQKLSRRYGRGLLDHMNRFGTIPGYAGGGMVWQNLWGIVKKQFPWARLTSAYRPGSVTASGNRSYHARGMAVDLAGKYSMDTAGMGKIFDFLRNNYAQSSEIIYSPAGGRQIKNGRNYNYTGAVRRMHFNHVHWANRTAFGGPTAGVEGGGDSYDLGGFLSPFEALKDKITGGIKNAGQWGELIKSGAQQVVEMPITWLKENAMKFIDVVGDVYSAAKNVVASGTAKAQGRVWATANGVKWSDLDYIVSRESGWNPKAKNPRSSAAGLPQFIAANQRHYGVYPITSKSVSEQLSAMHKYVHDRYGGWSGAVSYWKRNNHYDIGGLVRPTLFDKGGVLQPGTSLVANKTKRPEYILPAKVTDSLMRNGGTGGDTWNVYGPDATEVAYEVERMRRRRDMLIPA